MASMPKAARYVIGGLLIGGFWYLNRGRPPWEEALRTIVVFAVLMLLLRARLRKAGVTVHLVPLIASKAVLVVIAAVVEQELRHSTSDAPLVVAAGLAVAIMVLGPLGDGRFFSRRPQPVTADSATAMPERRGMPLPPP
ncbi:MAG TPA: hypothetical protein VGG75_35880 [Trebonia sp.]|jgi:peptidoglycan/LPS O-acetylase OafA/YrhL